MNLSASLRCLAVFLLFEAAVAHAVTCITFVSYNSPAPSNPDSAYADQGDGTVVDTRTGLMWKKCVEGQAWSGGTCTGTAGRYTWREALVLSVATSFAGHTDWRMPNLKELRSLVEECRSNPAINDTVFPNTPSEGFWSSTPDVRTMSITHSGGYPYTWYVDFALGTTGTGGVTRDNSINAGPIRFVRGGKSSASFDSLAGSSSYALNVTKLGTGSGTVASSPAGINCGSTCTTNYGGNTSVTLTATAASGSVFAGWGGDCAGTGSCTIGVTGTTNVKATFVLSQDCLFNWAERTYPQLFSPAGAASATFMPYYYRYYTGTQYYLATSSADNHVWVLGPVTGNNLLDVGPMTSFLTTAGCQ